MELLQKKFGTKEKPLDESIACRFAKLYTGELAEAMKQKREINKSLQTLRRCRPLLLGTLDQMVQKFILALRSIGGLVSTTIAISTAKALIARNPHLGLNHIDLDSSSWARSLLRRMGFRRRMKTTGKVEIPEGARKEAELLYLHSIVSVAERHSQQIENQLSTGKKIEEIDIKFQLTTIKPLHVKWLVEYYNEMTSESVSYVTINGWK